MNMPARLHYGFVVALGLICLLTAHWQMQHTLQFACYLVICILASGLKVELPEIFGSVPLSFLFVLLGVKDLSSGQLLMIGCAGALAQSLLRATSGRRPSQTVFH